MKLVLLALATASLLKRARRGRFASLEECEEAYEALLGNAPPPTTTSEPITEAPEPEKEPLAPIESPPKAKEVAPMKKVDAKPAYFPPESGTGEPSESGYDYLKHGEDWGSACQGGLQSPIDITKFVDIKGQTKSVLWFDYYADPALQSEGTYTLHNYGHGLTFDDASVDLGYVKIGADELEAFEYSFHAPSEHTIDGQVYPLELQILHRSASDKIVAVSVLFKNGDSNKFLAALTEAVEHMPKWHVQSAAANATIAGKFADAFNLEEVLHKAAVHPGGDLTFYNYQGSLTAPPCTGGVDWYVSAEAMEASKQEIAHVKASIFGSDSMTTGNNRHAQDLNDREVLVSHTGFQHHIKQHGHKKQVAPHTRGYSSQDSPW